MTPQEFKANRKYLNLTQKQLAIKLGLSKTWGDRHIRAIESGQNNTSKTLIKYYLSILKKYKKTFDK